VPTVDCAFFPVIEAIICFSSKRYPAANIKATTRKIEAASVGHPPLKLHLGNAAKISYKPAAKGPPKPASAAPMPPMLKATATARRVNETNMAMMTMNQLFDISIF